MSFTDDDLKKYKSWAEIQKPENVFEHIRAGDFLALLARLEAAERLICATHNNDSGTIAICLTPCEACDAIKAWLRASGTLTGEGR